MEERRGPALTGVKCVRSGLRDGSGVDELADQGERQQGERKKNREEYQRPVLEPAAASRLDAVENAVSGGIDDDCGKGKIDKRHKNIAR